MDGFPADPSTAIVRREDGQDGDEEPGYRRLGRWYLLFALAMGAWGGLDALLLRTALVAPEASRCSGNTSSGFSPTRSSTSSYSRRWAS